MADKATHELRAFLEGIEGFDSTRVDECLSRLVDAGYDTIGVLKLAKKRDLIEDAGLKPGYALGIVSAAQTAVALSHSTEHGAMSKHGDGAETRPAQEQGPSARTRPRGKGSVVIERHHESSDSGGSPSLKSPGGESDGGAEGEARGEKKRKKRARNWTDVETDILLQAVSQKTKSKSCINESAETETWWDGIAKDVPKRTTLECRRRKETLVKSYNAIKKYCDEQNKEFRQLNEEDFRNMKDAEQKPATRLLERWYNQIGNRCPPRSKKKMRNQGAGSSLGNGADIVSSATTSRPRPRNPISCGLPRVESTKVLPKPHGEVDQSNPVSAPVQIADLIQLWTRCITVNNENAGVWKQLKATAFVTVLCLVIVWDSHVAELE